MSKKTFSPAIDKTNNKKLRSLLYFQTLCILPLLLILSFSGLSSTLKEENTIPPVSASYTTVNEHGKVTLCTISSNDSIEALNELKNTDCKLPVSNENNDQSVILITHSPYYETKQVLITTRNLLTWAYMAVHLYKVWDSGSRILWPPVCPCSGQPKIVTNTQMFFFTYYITSLLHHGWSYFSPYLLPEQQTHKDIDDTNDSSHLPSKDRAKGWTEALTSIISTFTEHPYASHILSLTLDSAAFKWDCRCAGYFTDAKGGLYFNGHLWMLLLNVAIFTTDLAIDYL